MHMTEALVLYDVDLPENCLVSSWHGSWFLPVGERWESEQEAKPLEILSLEILSLEITSAVS